MTRHSRGRLQNEHPFIRFLGKIRKLLEWGGFLLGLLLIASCTTLGFLKDGAAGGIPALLTSTIFAIFLVGLVFLIARLHLLSSMREDIEAIRRSLEERGEAPGGAERRAGD